MTNQLNPTRRFSKQGIKDTIPGVLPALALGWGSFVLYLITLAPSVLLADGGEFQFVPYILGIAHPTGYPLYLLLGWAWSHLLPIGDVAYRMNLFSAFWAAWAVGLSYLVALRFVQAGASGVDPIAARLSAVVAAMTFAVGQTFWSQALIAEVYSFNAFFVALILLFLFWLAECLTGEAGCRADPAPGRGPISRLAFRSLVLAAVFGLSLTHHQTVLLLLPGLLVYLWLARRSSRPPQSSLQSDVVTGRLAAPETRPLGLFAPRSLLRRAGFALALAVAVVLPLALYLYLPWRAPHTPYTTIRLSDSQTLTLYENTWRGFVNHVTARVFSPYLGAPASGLERAPMVWGLLRDQFGLAGIGLALVGLGRLIAGRRWPLLALSGLGFGAVVAFNLVYFIGDVHVLFIPAYLFVSLWLGLGVASVAQGVARGLVRWKGSEVTYSDFGQQGYQRLLAGVSRLAAQIVTLLALALPVALLIAHFPLVNQSGNIQAQAMWQPILSQPIPEGTVLLTNDRDEMMPLWYYQYVDGLRPDLLGLFPLIVTEPAYATLGGLVDQALSSQRPVYLIKPMPGLEVKVQMEPDPALPSLVRVIAPAMERPPLHPRQVVLAGVMRLAGYDQGAASARPGEPVTISLYWQPQTEIEHNYSSYIHLVDETGRIIAQSDHQPGGVYYPTSSWRPGEVLRDSHTLSIPEDEVPGVYRLVTGMYRYPSMEPLGGPADLGLLAIKNPADVLMTLSDKARSAVDTLRRSQVEFGERITLLSYEAELVDEGLKLSLYWQAERILDRNWTVFIRVLDNTGGIVAEHNSQPRTGRYPTSVWDPGEVVDDSHWLALPSGLPQGDYQVMLGLFSMENGESLPVLDSAGNPIGDSFPLITLTLTERKWQIKRG
ncbi:MAG: hypothetical protein Kow0063_22780 [Anaerolineae bacterium]